jgi:hypothetical protein
MTQYSSPYQPPSPQPTGYYGYDPRSELLAPAKRASILMYILAGLSLCCGACIAGVSPFIPWEQMNAPELQEARNMLSQAGVSMKVLFIAVGIIFMVPGLIYVILAFFVRKGGLASVITSIVLSVLAILWFLINLVSSLVHAASQPPSQVAGALCVSVVPLAMLILLVVWLIQAARNASQIRLLEAHQQAQYWQYQQQQQMYPQAGGYAPLPPQQPPQAQQLPPSQMPPPPTFDNQRRGPDGTTPQG